eukprot:102168_1
MLHHEVYTIKKDFNGKIIMDEKPLLGNYLLSKEYGNEGIISIIKCPGAFLVTMNNVTRDILVCNQLKRLYSIVIAYGNDIGKAKINLTLKNMNKKYIKGKETFKIRRVGFIYKVNTGSWMDIINDDEDSDYDSMNEESEGKNDDDDDDDDVSDENEEEVQENNMEKN